jgi:hypothetical protein
MTSYVTLWLNLAPQLTHPPFSQRVPGITRCNFRFAVLTEHWYEACRRALELRGTNPKHTHDRLTRPGLVSRFVRSSTSMEHGATVTGSRSYDEWRRGRGHISLVRTRKGSGPTCGGGPHRILDCTFARSTLRFRLLSYSLTLP